MKVIELWPNGAPGEKGDAGVEDRQGAGGIARLSEWRPWLRSAAIEGMDHHLAPTRGGLDAQPGLA